MSPQVTAYENVDPGFGWAADPREIVRSLPKHVQDRLKSRKKDYARNEDYNTPQDDNQQPILPGGRGRPKRTIERPYNNQQMLTLDAPLDTDNEMAIVLLELKNGENPAKFPEDRCDAVTGRNFGKMNLASTSNKMDLFHMTRKAINGQEFGLHSNGDEIFRIMVNYSGASSYLVESSLDEPTFSEAIKGPERREWIEAINQEIEGCLSRGTFKFVPRTAVKDRGRLVASKWVLKKKYKSNMELDKFKARVVAKGFMQTKGVDFNDTTSTTARSASWRCLIALASLKSWYILQADFISAYLAGDLKETVFM